MKKKILAACAAAALAMTMATNTFSYALEPLPYSSFHYDDTDGFLYALEHDFDQSFLDQMYENQSQKLQSFISDAETYGVYIPYVNGEDLSEKGLNMYTVDMFDRTNLYFQGDRDETGIQYMNESLINDELKAFAQENGISALLHQLAPSLEYDASYETTYTIGGNDYNVLVAPFEDDPRIFIFVLHENALFRIALYEEIAAANSTLEHLTFQQVRLNSQIVPGDVNGDGVLSISDVALLGKWLLGRPGIQLANWKAADLYEDGKLDVYDMCLMKKALLGDMTIEPEIPDVLFGYEKEEEHEYPTLTTTQKLALKCKAYCPSGETLKVDAAMGDLSLHGDEWDYDYEISSSDYFTKKDLIVNGKQSEYIKLFPKEEWENLDISGKEGEFDLYHHEISEIDFSGYETGSSGCIEFFFVVRHVGGSHMGMIQRMYFYVGEKGTAISNLSAEDARTNYHAVQNQNKPDNMPDIIDDYGEITDKMKAALYSTLEREYPGTDFSDFTFVYEPEHPLKSHLRSNVFSIYYKDVLLHGYANLNTDSNVYATIDRTSFLVDPAQIMQIDTDAPCLSPEQAVPYGNYESVQKVIYIDVHSNTLKLAYRAVVYRYYEDIYDAVTGEEIICIPYTVV